MYFIKTPIWLKKIYHNRFWDIEESDKKIYITFDDGPYYDATPFILNKLNEYKAKATFFCIGKNVVNEHGLYNEILLNGHTTGNHTHNHLNGWKTDNDIYIKNIKLASEYIKSPFFRPPYGRMKFSQELLLLKSGIKHKLIMWDVLSADFDQKISPQQCLENVVKFTRPGSIIVFHDSAKANKNMRYALSGTLDFFSEKGYQFCNLRSATCKKGGPE